MRHSVHILFGRNFAQTLQQMRAYIQKYGEKEHSPYFRGLLWNVNDENITLSEVELQTDNSFMANLENRNQISLKVKSFNAKNTDEAVQYFTDLQQATINLDNQGSRSQLHYCLCFPLYDRNVWNDVKACISILNAVERPIEIDLFGLSYDLAKLFAENTEDFDIKQAKKITAETLKNVLEIKKKPANNIIHFIVLQNCQTAGVALNLSTQTFIKVMGEFALLCIESYDELFGLVQPNSELQGLGLSVLSLDKYYYVEYLLHKAYLLALEREGIQGIDKIEEVDINLATNKAQEILKNKIHILSEFFDEEIQKRLSNKKGHELIVQEITPILQMKMAQLAAGCEAFINDDELSIPAKRAIFSALLGEDDELFTNNRQFTDEPLIIDDVDAEAMQTFINANNALLNTEEQKEEAVFSESGDSIVSPLSKIKKLRTEIIRTTANIRRLEKEVEELGSQVENIEDAKKSLTEDGFFEFGGISYQLLPKIEEKPLEEDYAPHEVKSTAIDLRSGFTAIKNQGQVGACTAFSLTSIYEYILKSNKLQECDLSEAFLYYNARKKDGKENELTGSRIDLAIETLVENGICLEEKWVNKQGGEEEIRAHYTTEPSQEAKDDAALRKVKKAVNVKLTLNDIRSALEDGYPVEFCTTLFDTFGNNAVVTYPSEDEMKQANFYDNQSRYHAMVICGYSDEEKLFVVRNSWGTEFGDKGYCYIPYSYITNSELTPCAYAITEVATTNVSAKKGIVKRTSLPFGDDVKMKFAIKKNALEEEKRILAGIISYYSSLKNQYNELHEQILNPHNQTALTTSTQTRLTNERQELETQYTAACDNMDEQLNVFANNTKSKAIRMAMPFALVMLIAEFYRWLFKKGLLCLNDFDSGMFDYLYREGFAILWIGIIALVTVGGFALWRIIGRKNHKENASQLMDYDKTTKRVRTVLIISFLIIGILVGIYSIFYDKQLGEKMLDYMYQKSLWVILLSFIIGIITVSAFIYLRIKKRKQLKEELQVVCDDRFNLVELKKRELKENRLRMHFAGMLLDKNSEVEHNLTKKYQFMQSFFVNLNTWHTLENASLKTMDDQVQAPFISVINNECLDKYFEQNGKELTKNISFCDVFVKNYQLSEDGIAAFQITLKRTFCEELLASISGFTIYDYFARPGEKLFLESKAPKALLSELETKSDVFVQHSKSPNTSKNLFVFTRNEDEKHSWLAISRPHFSCSPTQSPIVSPLKLVLTQMEELSASDLYL